MFKKKKRPDMDVPAFQDAPVLGQDVSLTKNRLSNGIPHKKD